MHRLAITPFLLLLSLPAAAQNTEPSIPTVVTQGRSIIQRTPDRAFITLSVETRANNPRDAQRQNADAMNAVQARLAAAKVPKDAIRTAGYTIQQEFDFPDGKRVPRGFVARNALEVRLDDVSRVGEILEAVVQSGATNVDGIRFDLRDRDAVEREALRLAVADARARADAAAAGTGQTIDRILRIEESREGPIMPMPRLMAMSAEQASAPAIEPGTIEIQARVTLSASLK